MVQILLVLANDLDRVAVIQAHHTQNALGIGDAALHIVYADIVITLGGGSHDSLHFSKIDASINASLMPHMKKIGNLDLFHHHNDLQT